MPEVTTDERIQALREFCERHSLGLNAWEGDQRDPQAGVVLSFDGIEIRSLSLDGEQTALANLEEALMRLTILAGDTYLHDPHPRMGRLS